eukprot:TRINITY_DN18212_c1_g1_i1.p1 TRINITY_DN18212_c1_g1~~TRINITY_DN18212_c1_g1_i1.p1  ORF type:complete len:121 (+),score=9.18 TRINITY_DN18212_c1_g1_i1:147-509(+)
MLSTVAENTSCLELDCMPEIELIVEQFRGYDSSKKLQVLNKLKEIAKPETTSLIESDVKTKVRGRPKLKLHNSTKRNPSAFEVVESAQVSYSPALTGDTIVSSGACLVSKQRFMHKLKVI